VDFVDATQIKYTIALLAVVVLMCLVSIVLVRAARSRAADSAQVLRSEADAKRVAADAVDPGTEGESGTGAGIQSPSSLAARSSASEDPGAERGAVRVERAGASRAERSAGSRPRVPGGQSDSPSAPRPDDTPDRPDVPPAPRSFKELLGRFFVPEGPPELLDLLDAVSKDAAALNSPTFAQLVRSPDVLGAIYASFPLGEEVILSRIEREIGRDALDMEVVQATTTQMTRNLGSVLSNAIGRTTPESEDGT